VKKLQKKNQKTMGVKNFLKKKNEISKDEPKKIFFEKSVDVRNNLDSMKNLLVNFIPKEYSKKFEESELYEFPYLIVEFVIVK
jgi:hypothetical protein